MRSLFLIAILFTLVTIAVKEPNQTAWDVIESWKSRIGILTDSGSYPETGKPKKATPPARISMDYESLKYGLSNALDKVAPELSSKIRKTVYANKTSIARAGRQAAAPSSLLAPRVYKPRVMPKSTLKDVPKLPAAPVNQVKAVALNEQAGFTAPPSGEPRLRPRPKQVLNYAEIRGYYENANRLLNEIK